MAKKNTTSNKVSMDSINFDELEIKGSAWVGRQVRIAKEKPVKASKPEEITVKGMKFILIQKAAEMLEVKTNAFYNKKKQLRMVEAFGTSYINEEDLLAWQAYRTEFFAAHPKKAKESAE